MKRRIEHAQRDGRTRRLAGARGRARVRAVSLYALLLVVEVVLALVALAALLALLGRGE
jgi:hypothetical protein